MRKKRPMTGEDFAAQLKAEPAHRDKVGQQAETTLGFRRPRAPL
jgi:hypothetical protein